MTRAVALTVLALAAFQTPSVRVDWRGSAPNDTVWRLERVSPQRYSEPIQSRRFCDG